MASVPSIDLDAVIAVPRFQELHRKKQTFLTTLMIVSVAFYFLLPIGAAYFQDLYRVKVWGVINFGLMFALSQFIVAWGIAYFYSWRANRDFDRMARELAAHYEKKTG